jgi:hypothetical protein
LVAGYYGLDLLLKLSKAQVGESSVSGTMRLEHLKKLIYFLVPKSSTHRGLNCIKKLCVQYLMLGPLSVITFVKVLNTSAAQDLPLYFVPHSILKHVPQTPLALRKEAW